MFSIGDLIGDASFLGNAALLILGAVLTGFLVPFVKARLDDASARRKQLLEAELARQSEFLQSQIDLLTSFSDATWEFLFDAFKVSYAEAWEEEAAKNAAWEAYEPLSWKHLGKIRAIISKSKRLLSEACHKNLIATYDWLWHYDDELAIHLSEGHTQEEWRGFHEYHFAEAAARMDQAIAHLANELRLSAGSEVGPIERGKASRTLASSVGSAQ
jgi:hypothetical protein